MYLRTAIINTSDNAEGPKSEKRREDVIGIAVHVMRMPRVSSLKPCSLLTVCQGYGLHFVKNITRAASKGRFFEVEVFVLPGPPQSRAPCAGAKDATALIGSVFD